MGNWAQLYADLTAQLQAGQALGFWDNAFVGFYQSFVAAGRWRLYLNGLLTTLEATILALLLGGVLGVVGVPGLGQAGTAPEFGGQLHGVEVGDRLPSVAVQYAYFWEDHF